jgi:SAM-dependent methyltransferase
MMSNDFSAHNIEFGDGTRTMGDGELLADHRWCLSAKRTLRLIYGENIKGRRIADLGCLEGGYAVEFARMGMEVVGLEVRSSNIENCLRVKDRAGLPNLQFFQDDVWNLPDYGQFDAIFCCGLLYHLDRPREFLHLLGRASRDAVLVNTCFAPRELTDSEAPLSEMTEHESLPGRWYKEHNGEAEKELDQMKWASWGNQKSFWPTREALCETLGESGFDIVFEQHDAARKQLLVAGRPNPQRRSVRAMFVGIRGSAATP